MFSHTTLYETFVTHHEKNQTSVPSSSSSSSPSSSHPRQISAFWMNTPNIEITHLKAYLLTDIFISITFCLLSLIVIILQKKYKTLASKNIISLIISVLIFESILACELLQLLASLNHGQCYFLAVLSHWASISNMLWMNVLAIDIWRASYVVLNHDLTRKNEQFKWFVYYSLYAWGLSAVFITAAVVVDNVDWIPIKFKPDYVDEVNRKCWMSSWHFIEAFTIYSTVPMSTVIITSLVLLLLSYVNIRKTPSFVPTGFSLCVRRRFMMYVQLTVVRDIGFLMNFIPLRGTKYAFISYLIFGVNQLLGLYLFFIFVFNFKKAKCLIINLYYRAKCSEQTREKCGKKDNTDVTELK